jgi:hypothetical protein
MRREKERKGNRIFKMIDFFLKKSFILAKVVSFLDEEIMKNQQKK